MKTIQHITNQDENLSFYRLKQAVYPCLAFAKSNAERGNSNLQKANNNSTPILNRAFFVYAYAHPKETNRSDFGGVGFFSMVGRNRKGLALCRFPFVTIFHPIMFYRQIVESLAVVLEKLTKGLSTMLYQFLITTGDKPLKITILANSEQEARSRLQLSSSTILIARKKGGVYA